MKRTKTIFAGITVALLFAVVLSCSEQDEQPVASSLAPRSSNATLVKATDRVSGRVGGPIFNSSVGGALDLATAKKWAVNFREKHPNEIRGHFFGYEIVEKILGEPGAVGIRIYYALDENGEKKLLIVGVDAEGNDLLPKAGVAGGRSADEEQYNVGDYSFPCPTYCGTGGI